MFAAAVAAYFLPWPIAELHHVVPIMILAAIGLNQFVLRYDRCCSWYRTKALPYALQHGLFVVFTCVVLVLNSLTLAMGAGTTTIALNVFILVLAAIWHAIGFLLRRRIPEKNIAYRWSSSTNGRSRASMVARRSGDVAKNMPRVITRWFYATGRSRALTVSDVRAADRACDPAAADRPDRLRFRSAVPDRRDFDDGYLSAGDADCKRRQNTLPISKMRIMQDRRHQIGQLDGRPQAARFWLG